jgi:hypothetical protein
MMENLEPESPPIGFTIRHPDRLLAAVWVAVGLLLLLSFFLPNFEMAGMDLNGPKLVDMLFRQNADMGRLFDDAGFFMMVTVPIACLALGLACLTLGTLTLLRRGPQVTLFIAAWSLVGLIYMIIGAIVIDGSGSDAPFLSKLVPKPTMVYWLALVLHVVLSAATTGFLILVRRPAATSL